LACWWGLWTIVKCMARSTTRTCTSNREPSNRTRRGASTQSFQDRYGYHTFRRGDIVVYREAEGAEMQHVGESMVWGVCVHEGSEADDQSRKFLVLHELASARSFSSPHCLRGSECVMLPR
jgi:hypothetical protein